MSFLRRLSKTLVGMLLLLFGALSLCAAEEGARDLSEATLEQLGQMKVYTASRHLQAGADAPSSVTVVTADDIEQHGYRTLADVLQTVRGFFVTSDRNYSSVGVRGFARPGDFNSRILLLVDGHRLNDNIYDEAMIGTEFPIDIDLISRIEIIRGPVSSLYGSNALFAVINIITKRGQDLKGIEFSAEAGSFNSYEGRVSYGRKIQPMEFLVSGTFYGSRGHNQLFFPQFNTPQTNYGIASHADDDKVGSGLATLSYRDFTLQATYGTREKGIPTAPYATVFNDAGTRTTDSHGYIDLRYEHTFAHSWGVMARGFYDRYTYQGTYIYASDSPGQVSPNLDFGDGKWWGTEVQLSKTVFARHRITVGGEYRDNIRQDQINYSLNPYTLYLDDRRQSFVAAGYLQDEVTISRTLTLNAGLRHDYYGQFQSSTDPRAALIYRPWNETALKFIYGEAFRAPNVFERYYSVFPNAPNPALRPEKIRTTEFIWEQGLTKHLWFSTSAFHSWIDGLINEQPVSGGSLVYRNLQDVDSNGIEFEVKGQLSNGLEASASYSFQQTKDRQTGQFLTNSPRTLLKLNATEPFLRRRLFASLDAQYRSRIESLASGSISPFTVVSASLLGRTIGKHLDLSATIYNLFDKKYFDPPSVANLQLPIEQDGRSFRVKLLWHWGE